VIEGKAEASKIIEACEIMPFLKKLVVVKKSELFNSKKSGSSNNKNDELITYLQNCFL